MCNIGDPQQMGQTPVPYFREVLSLVTAPHVLQDADKRPLLEQVYSQDVLARADTLAHQALRDHPGAYTPSPGMPFVVKHVAEFITRRDDASAGRALRPASTADIHITNGASAAISNAMQLLLSNPTDGFMFGVPVYPLYSASVQRLNATAVTFPLDEAKAWSCHMHDLDVAFDAAAAKGVRVRAIVITNPGNPTGNVLSRDNIRDIIRWAARREVVLFADEVYQENIYADGKKFHSFREVLLADFAESGEANTLPLFSFHTCSKGAAAECGIRCGYVEVINLPPAVHAQWDKLMTLDLCANVSGQVLLDLMISPPADPATAAKVARDRATRIEALKRRAAKLVEQLNAIEGIHSNPIEGAMYAFPTLRLPAAFIEEARKLGKAADLLWALRLVEEEGVVVVPGSGFGQVEGTYHFRTTILPPDDQMEEMTQRIAAFQKRIIDTHGPIAS
jgi:alanine transaminase